MKKYQMTFKIGRKVLKWERFYNISKQEAFNNFKEIIENEYYGKKIRYVNFEVV